MRDERSATISIGSSGMWFGPSFRQCRHATYMTEELRQMPFQRGDGVRVTEKPSNPGPRPVLTNGVAKDIDRE